MLATLYFAQALLHGIFDVVLEALTVEDDRQVRVMGHGVPAFCISSCAPSSQWVRGASQVARIVQSGILVAIMCAIVLLPVWVRCNFNVARAPGCTVQPPHYHMRSAVGVWRCGAGCTASDLSQL